MPPDEAASKATNPARILLSEKVRVT